MKKMGPAPTPMPAPTGLSPARQAVLAWLRSATDPVLVSEASAALGLHPNTAREHLDALCSDGLASRSRGRLEGRGRPPWTYESTHDAAASGLREYVGLVSALAEHVLRSSDRPSDDARRAGRRWGEGLLPHHRLAEGQRATRALAALDDLGFSPDLPDPEGVVRLRTCPLLDVAEAYPEVVCSVHLGLVEGALSALGRPDDDPSPVELVPFAEPGACLLRIPYAETTAPEPDAQR